MTVSATSRLWSSRHVRSFVDRMIHVPFGERVPAATRRRPTLLHAQFRERLGVGFPRPTRPSKHVFALHGVNAAEAPVLRKKLVLSELVRERLAQSLDTSSMYPPLHVNTFRWRIVVNEVSSELHGSHFPATLVGGRIKACYRSARKQT